MNTLLNAYSDPVFATEMELLEALYHQSRTDADIEFVTASKRYAIFTAALGLLLNARGFALAEENIRQHLTVLDDYVNAGGRHA